MVGISRERRSFSVMLFEELGRRGCDVIPVNPSIPNVLGRRCYASLQDIQPPVSRPLS
jgi:predicted CoA-binding protein